MEKNEKYNGWKNYETWNVSLWIRNDESFYDFARACKRALSPYKCFASDLREVDCLETPDKVAWNDSNLDIQALDEMIGEL